MDEVVENQGAVVRATPVQGRANETVTNILSAASLIIEQQGLHQLTTSRIAEIAGLSSGAMYRYFPNKESVLQSMAEQRLAEFRELHRACAPERFASWMDWQNALIDRVAVKYEKEPGLARYIDVIATLPEIRKLYDDYDGYVIEYLCGGYSHFKPDLQRATVLVAVEVLHASVHSVLKRGIELEKAHWPRLIAKLKSMVLMLMLPHLE